MPPSRLRGACASPREMTICVHSPPQNAHRQRPEEPSAWTPGADQTNRLNRPAPLFSVPFKMGRWSGRPDTETASGVEVSRAGGGAGA